MDPNKRARYGSFLNTVDIPVPHAQKAYEMLANLERDKYWAEKIKDTCVEENQLLKRKLSEVPRLSDKLVEKDRRILELVKAHREVQLERNELLIEKDDLEEQLKEVRETNRGKDTRISNLNEEVARLIKVKELKEKGLQVMKKSFAEEKTRLCKQLKSAEDTIQNIHKLSGLPERVED